MDSNRGGGSPKQCQPDGLPFHRTRLLGKADQTSKQQSEAKRDLNGVR